MKRWLLLLIPLFICCDIINYDIFENFYFDENNFTNAYNCYFWIHNNIVYEDEGWKDYWKTPQETWNSRSGDCEDMSILLMAMIYRLYGEESKLVKVDKNGDGFVDHASVMYNGSIYDPNLLLVGPVELYEYTILGYSTRADIQEQINLYRGR